MTGRRVGPYLILRAIGAGGMGAVYLAERADQQFQRLVAIKLVVRGFDNQEILARFRQERQTLASLDHPNIVRLLDGGTTEEGLPYLVMDYVEGVPLVEHCTQRRLSTADRLRLFLQVSSAVHYAHQHLVIHRDLKPGNVLVTPEGQPKLLDFGIAKVIRPAYAAAAPEVTSRDLHPMTMRYASPEQIRGEPISIATDVYSLGVLLHELLTGRDPYALSDPTALAIAFAVCEGDPQISRDLNPDLDNIIRMAMRKEPARRYPSVEHLAEDVRRHLDGRPVLARPSTLSYRARKFYARHKAGVLAGASAVVLLVAGVAGIIWQSSVAQIERGRAERRFNDVRLLANSFLFDFHDAIRDLPGSTPARRLVVAKATEYLDRLAKEAAGSTELQLELGEGYLRLGGVQGNPYLANLGDLQGALNSYRKALAIAEEAARTGSSNPRVLSLLARGHQNVSDVLPLAGDPAQAAAHARKAVELFERLARAQPGKAAPRLDLSGAYETLGDILGKTGIANLGDRDAALNNYRKALDELEAVRAQEPSNSRARRGLGVVSMKLGDMLVERGRLQEAIGSFQRSRQLLEPLAADPHNAVARRTLAILHRKTGMALAESGDAKAALERLRESAGILEALAAADPANRQARMDLAVSLRSTADLQDFQGERAGALRDYLRVIEIIEGLAREDPSNMQRRGQLGEMQLTVGGFLAESGQKAEARRLSSRGLATLRELADRAEATADELNRCALALLQVDPEDLRSPATALFYAERAVSQSKGRDPVMLDTLAQACFETGNLARAIQAAEDGLALLPPPPPGQPVPHTRRVLESHLARFKAAGGKK